MFFFVKEKFEYSGEVDYIYHLRFGKARTSGFEKHRDPEDKKYTHASY